MSSRDGRDGFVIFDASMTAALRRHYRRSQAEMVSMVMPFDELLAAESDGLDGELTEYEWRQRAVGARAVLAFIAGRGVHPVQLLKSLFVVGRGMHVEPFASLPMEDAAILCGEKKASHSARAKLLSKLLEAAGMKGVRLPGQKSPLSSEAYAAAARRTCNRRKKVKGWRRKPAEGSTANSVMNE